LTKEEGVGSHQENNNGSRDDRGSALEIGIESIPSKMRKPDGGEIFFTRAVLVVNNTGLEPVFLTPRADLTQEGGIAHEVTGALSGDLPAQSLAPGGKRQWDLFDLLTTGHPGVASKVHLFGYKAVLNWWFVLSVRIDYRLEEESVPRRTPLFRARFRWNAKPAALDQVDLSIELP
jgi:hypothetical protein